MKLVEFLSHLNSLDIRVWLEEEKLKYQAPKGAMTPVIKQEIGSRKSEIIAFLKQAKTISKSSELAIVPMPRDNKIPLSFAQQRLWFLHQLSPDSQSYNMLDALRLEGSLDIVALEKSLNELVRRHEILRTTFPTVDGEAIQHIAEPTAFTLPIHDLQGLSAEEQTAQIQQMVKSLASKPLDLASETLVQFTLLKLNSQEHVLLLKMHHIIYDGWSLNIFFSELSKLYAAFSQGLPSPLPELPIQYADFALWQRQWLTGEVLERQLNYWQQQLADAPPVVELPTDFPRSPVQTFKGAVESFQLDQDLTQRLRQLSQNSEATLFMTLLAAFLVIISRYSGQSDLVVGSPIANRNNKSVEPLIGFFANTLALRGDLSDNPSFKEFLAQIKQTTLSAYAHQDLPFEMLVEKLQPDRDLSRNPLVQVIFSLQSALQSEGTLSGLTMQSMPLPIDIQARFDLEVLVWENPEGLEGVWFYDRDLFDASTITRMGQHFQTVLQEVVANPEVPVAEIPLLSQTERHQLLVEWNNIGSDYPQYQCIHKLFEEQVERTPDSVAVVYSGQQITYSELNCRANQLAHYLQSLEIKLEDKIGICIERSPLMVIAILAILKAGGAYVPLDPAYPSERLAFMIKDVKCPIIFTQNNLSKQLPVDSSQQVIDIHSKWESIAQHSTENLVNKVTPNNLAYIIYTSGSTGTPKGIEVPHRSIMGFMFGADYIRLDAHQIWLQHSSISWDALTLELWPSLLFGGLCVLYPGNISTPEGLSKIIKEQGVNTLWLTCALFNLIIDTIPESLLGVKQLLIGGEALSIDHVHRALVLLPETQIINGYGPSECTVFTCCYPIPKKLDKKFNFISIGKPIGDRKIYLLDYNLQPVPVGVYGEIHVGGASVARGYLNQLTLTNEKFIANPLIAGDILYKTGDLARYLPDGNLEFLGRIDNQVKIRGFRIELGEIEAVLSQLVDVQVSCVIVREDTPGDKRLVAYVVPQPETTLTTSTLRQFLTNKLPSYMIPSAFVILESLPLTPNGKVNRRALKAPSNTIDVDTFIEPRNQLEFQLVQIWSKILKLDKVGVQDNFFELGGHSLLAPYLMAQIKQQFGKNIPLTSLFQNPTIEELATILQKDSDDFGSSYVVAIQPNGSNLPFFCVPGVGGKPFYLSDLGRYLGTDQPLYSFQAYDFEGELERATRIEDMASNYIQAMQTVQPQGPYYLGGHSFGGRVAFEMAQQLVAQGQQVALLVMIDIASPTEQEHPVLMNYLNWDHARWLAELIEVAELSLGRETKISYDNLKSLPEEEQLKYALQHLKMVNTLPPNAETKQLKNMMEVYKANTLSQIDYLPKQIYPAQITLLRATEIPPVPSEDAENYLYFKTYSELSQDSDLGWGELSSEPVDIDFVPGSHLSMIAEPHVQVLGKRLKACIEQAQVNVNAKCEQLSEGAC
ncbi:MAG: amino acid adenylation domain-containing protein [Symploca sp. SIO3C6]|nr:amino acid adenylation domain-containing protein [Symploca sp. SIO3C6]